MKRCVSGRALFWSAVCLSGWVSAASSASVAESARAIPVCQEVDVVVVGGLCGAVAAAQSAARAGATVFLVASRPYVGDDLAGSMRLWLEPGETPATPLARALFIQTNSALAFTYAASQPSSARHEIPAMRCPMAATARSRPKASSSRTT